MISLIADHTSFSRHRGNCAPVVIALPISIGDVVPKAAAPWLAGVDAGGNGDAIRCGDNQAVGTAKGTVQKARIIGDVMHRCKNSRVDTFVAQDAAQPRKAGFIFRIAKGQNRF